LLKAVWWDLRLASLLTHLLTWRSLCLHAHASSDSNMPEVAPTVRGNRVRS